MDGNLITRINGIYTAPMANSADGMGKEIEGEETKWNTFGENQLGKAKEIRTMQDTAIGFAIASPILLLKEGDRIITLTLELSAFELTAQDIEELAEEPDFGDTVIGILETFQDQKFTTQEAFENDVKKIINENNLDYNTYKTNIEDKADKANIFLTNLNIGAFQKALKLFLSGENDWIKPKIFDEENVVLDTNLNLLELSFTLSKEQTAVVTFNKSNLNEPFKTDWPVLKVLLDTNQENHQYHSFYELNIKKAAINVDVKGVRDLILQNEEAQLDPSKPFQPFGAIPKLGSSFYIGSAEVFQKKLDEFTVNIQWDAVPEEDLGIHYDGYGNVNNSDFQVDVNMLYNKSWDNELANGFQLFDQNDATQNIATTIQIPLDYEIEENVLYERDTTLQELEKYDHTTQRGFIQLVLKSPTTPFKAFGNKEYPKIYTEAAINLANNNNGTLPNEPYTPSIKSLSLDYTSSHMIEILPQINEDDTEEAIKIKNEDNYKARVEQFFQVGAFGNAEVHPHTHQGWAQALPQYLEEGNLYIGVQDLVPPQNLSILFQVAEGSADPEIDISKEKIKWGYLSDNQWIELKDFQVLSDSTKKLQKSGIIVLSIPKDAKNDNTLMSSGLCWLRASVSENSGGFSKLIDIRTQAVTASFVDMGNDPNYLKASLPAHSIGKLEFRQSTIKGVLQPYASFDGKIAEQKEQFYIRVSERLRHKHRGAAIWDYERMVLEQFPAVYKAKCLNHTNQEVEIAPGFVTLIVIPSLVNKTGTNMLEPKVSATALTEIKAYMQQYISMFVQFEVQNPIYEQLLVSFKVKFKEGFDEGYYEQLLNEEIKAFLSPWAFSEGRDIVFGGKIHKSSIITFVEERTYVDFVNEFRLYHFYEGKLPQLPTIDYIEQENDNLDFDFEEIDMAKSKMCIQLDLSDGTKMILDFVVEFVSEDGLENQLDEDSINEELLKNDLQNFFGLVKNIEAIYKTSILAYIKQEIEYVKSIENLKVYHQVSEGVIKEETEVAIATTTKSVLVSASMHDITTVGEDYACKGVKNIGIGFMILEYDFIVYVEI